MKRAAQLEKYRNGECLQYLTDVLKIITEENAKALSVVEQQALLKSAVEDFRKKFQPLAGSEITPEITVLDKRRDDALKGIRLMIQAYTYHKEEKIKQQAAHLNHHLEGYGNRIDRLRYQLETATITGLLKDWDAEYKAAIAALNLSYWVEELRSANTLFSSKYIARVQEQATIETGVIPQIRGEAIQRYRALIKYLEAYGLIAPSKLNHKILNEIYALAIKYNTAIERGGSTENTEELTSETEEKTAEDI